MSLKVIFPSAISNFQEFFEQLSKEQWQHPVVVPKEDNHPVFIIFEREDPQAKKDGTGNLKRAWQLEMGSRL